MAINATAPFLLAQHALPVMIERGFGGILFISTVATLNGDVVGPLYAVSNAALHGLAHFLAVRVTGEGVTATLWRRH